MRRFQLFLLALTAIVVAAGCSNVEKIKNRNARLEDQLQSLRSEKSNLQQELDTAQDTIESLRSQLREAQSAREKLNNVLEKQRAKKQELQQQRQELEKLVKNLSGVGVRSGAQGNYIVLEDKILFALGKAQLSDKAQQTLDSIVEYLKKKPDQEIRIDGHTDGVPVKSDNWEDNYHLAAMRAHAVFNYLVNQGIDPKRIHIAGYGPNRPRKEPPKPEAPVKKNRRVEILLMPEEQEVDSLLQKFE